MRECDFLIIGAGIAGTSCAHFLPDDAKAIVLEAENRPGYHTTGRSVAMYTEAYGPRTVRALAKSGYGFLTNPPEGFADVPLSEQSAFLFVAREDQLTSLKTGLAAVQELSPKIAMISPKEAIERVPILRRDYLAGAFLDPYAMKLNVDAIHQGYIKGLKNKGGDIVCDAAVTALERKSGKWQVTTKQGIFSAPVVVNAAGAWVDEIADLASTRRVGIVPKRRTVISFPPPGIELDNDWPFVIDCEEEFFFKVEAGTILGSPSNQDPVPPQDVQPEELDIALAIDRLQRATTMTVPRLNRSWAGLRSFVADEVPVVGFTDDVEGFFWCAGQGGYGIETSIGMGRTCAALLQGQDLPEDVKALDVRAEDLSPQRFSS
jgi:D-arginine dehydrogenase